MEYTFVKDYKHDESKRLSFNRLAKETFEIDFEPWYKAGFWNGNFVCYSFEYGGEIVSNVSLNTMKLIMEGRETDAVQIGTVMTHPDHRRKGLAKNLLERVIADYEDRYGFFILAADEEAKPLYENCGFKPADTNKFIIDLAGYRRSAKPPVPADVPSGELLAAKRGSVPLSKTLSAKGDEHVLMFYCMQRFGAPIYKLRPDVYVIFQTDGDTLHLYDILSPREIGLEEIIESITHAEVNKVSCHFTPDGSIKGLKSAPDPNAGWMARGGSFPSGACFPTISQT